MSCFEYAQFSFFPLYKGVKATYIIEISIQVKILQENECYLQGVFLLGHV